MQKNEDPFAPQISFKELTPQMMIEHEKPNPLYEKAYLSREAETDDPFAINTSTWD